MGHKHTQKNEPFSLQFNRERFRLSPLTVQRLAVDKHQLAGADDRLLLRLENVKKKKKPTCYKFIKLLQNDTTTNTLSMFLGGEREGVRLKASVDPKMG